MSLAVLTADTSAPPRQRSRVVRYAIVCLLAVSSAVAGYFGFWLYHLKRLQVIAPGVFLRSAQPTEFGLRHLVNHYGVKTVISLQLFDFRLHGGLLDPGKADGRKEAEFVESLGARHVQFPMGDEQCWPWPTPWQLEEFLRIVDDPANRPVLIHCMGGRHRTGTLSALYRLEYDRWSIDDALREMYSFDFGLPIPTQEHNLRTYAPRPMPTADEWQSLVAAFSLHCATMPADYAELLRQIQGTAPDSEIQAAAVGYIAAGKPFAVPLAERLLQVPNEPLAAAAAQTALSALQGDADERSTTSAAAIVADFGSPAERQSLLDILERESKAATPSPFYESLVRGVTNRYTPNRIAYLKPLLDDERRRMEPAASKYRYCDTAVTRLASITDELPIIGWSEEALATQGLALARTWFEQHPEEWRPGHLLPPTGRHTVEIGDGPQEEDLSKMRRKD